MVYQLLLLGIRWIPSKSDFKHNRKQISGKLVIRTRRTIHRPRPITTYSGIKMDSIVSSKYCGKNE